MTVLSSLALVALFAAPADGIQRLPATRGDAVLVEFSSQRCAYCQAMQPIMTQLSQQGCPVQVIDVDQHQDTAKQFHITGVPTFVALTGGRETGRVVGPATYERLVTLYQSSGVGGRESGVRDQEPGARSPRLATTEFRSNEAALATSGGAEALQAAAAATVRIKVEDATGYGFGTGTIIDTHEGEALVVTCGHLFRESQGKGKLTADLFVSGAAQSVPGQLIAYDLDRDIALLSIRVPSAVRAAQVAPPALAVRPGDRAFTLGCDKGADPSVRQTQITAVNKYQGKPNYTATGQPVDGRSGGGLFTADGLLIGICNAADPADNEGLYAGLASIHWQLDQIGQSEIYQRSARAAMAAAGPAASVVAPAAAEIPVSEATPLPQLPPQMPATQFAGASPVPARQALTARQPQPDQEATPLAAGDDSEIVFIVRSKRDPAQRSEVYVVDQAPPDLIARITHAARATGERQATLARSRASTAVASRPGVSNSPVVRGQSN
jgi:thiol-disulfide isomerase/thioredoxin